MCVLFCCQLTGFAVDAACCRAAASFYIFFLQIPDKYNTNINSLVTCNCVITPFKSVCRVKLNFEISLVWCLYM